MVFVVLSILSFVFQTIGNKEFGLRIGAKGYGLPLFNAISNTVVTLLFALMGGLNIPSLELILFALAFAVLFILTIKLVISAMTIGPLSMTQLIANLGMVIPIGVGMLLWGEQLTLNRTLGIACLIGVLLLSSGNSGGGKVSGKWLLLTLCALCTNGTLSVVQKLITMRLPEVSVAGYSFWCFGFAMVISWLNVIWLMYKKVDFKPLYNKDMFMTSICMGLGTAGGNGFLLAAFKAGTSTLIVVPSVYGGVVLAVWASSILLYKEKLTRKLLLAMVVGVAGLLLLSI